MEKVLNYDFGGFDVYPYRIDYKDIVYYLVPVLSKELGKTKQEIQKKLENDKFFEKMFEKYYEDIKEYYEEEAEWEYEESQEEPETYSSYDAWCWSRNPNLRNF